MDKLKIFIISEDKSKDSFNVIKNIILKSFRNIEPNFDENEIEFIERYNNKNKIVNGSMWKNFRNPKVREFFTEISSELVNDNSFIFWHIDGDVVYSDFLNDFNNSINYKKFSEVISRVSKMPVFSNNMTLGDKAEKLFLLLPCYSIESWLYPYVLSINLKSGETFKYTDENFDEILKIKDNSGISSNYNLKLSTKFRHNDIVSLGKSYATSFNKYNNHELFNTKLKSILSSWVST